MLLPGAPEPRWGVQSGDVTASSAVIWSRSDRPARMVVEWSASRSFEGARRVAGTSATAATDFTAKAKLDGLPVDTLVRYRVRFEGARVSEWVEGSLRTAPIAPRDVVFAWSGDTNGQGWGIDPSRGGMPAYAALLERAPELFVHCGDAIYADDPIPPSIALPDGGVWTNVVTAAKSKVAETLDDFRGAFLYPRESREVRALSAAVPLLSIWDDHEVHNNWFPGQVLEDERYAERRASVLAERARRARAEHLPTLHEPHGPMFRSVAWGPLLEIFLVDGRSYRTPNHPEPPGARFFGAAQRAWLEEALTRSRAVWKVVACDMPIGLVVSEPAPGGGLAFDGIANTGGAPAGRELELAQLLATLKARDVRNVLWVTADVHYASALRYDPARARFRDVLPFWELVAGPMHATSFPRKPLDDTFGPELVWASAGPDTFGSPATGAQSFGLVRVDGRTAALSVTFVDARGRDLHRLSLQPDRG